MPAANADDILTARVPRLADDALSALLLRAWGIEGAFAPLSGERDQNLEVTAADGRAYVLKIANAAEPAVALALQSAALDHVAAADPSLPVPRAVRARDGAALVPVAHDGATFMARLVTHLAGEPALDFCPTPGFRRAAGRLTGRLDRALAGFRHPGASRQMIWDLRRAASLEERIHHIPDPGRRAVAGRVMADFKARALPAFARVRRQVIHNDIHQNNILRDPRSGEITGVIDFGDMVETLLVAEAAIAVAHQLYREDDVLGVAAEFLGAYAAAMPLEPAEIAILFDLVKMRLAAREIIVAWRSATADGPVPYRADISEMGWEALQHLLSIDPAHATRFLEKAMTAPSSTQTTPATHDAAYDALMARRRAAMGPMYKEFYRRPFMPEGEYVGDRRRRCTISTLLQQRAACRHCHPHVVRQVSRQLAAFNPTHSAIRARLRRWLLATMPDHLTRRCRLLGHRGERTRLAHRHRQYRGDWRVGHRRRVPRQFHDHWRARHGDDPARPGRPFVGSPRRRARRRRQCRAPAADYAKAWRGDRVLATRGCRRRRCYARSRLHGLYRSRRLSRPAIGEVARPAACSATRCRRRSAAPAPFLGLPAAGIVPDIVTMGRWQRLHARRRRCAPRW